MVPCISQRLGFQDIFGNEIISNGYSIYHLDRAAKGRSVSLAVQDNFNSRQLESPPEVKILVKMITVLIIQCNIHTS